MTTMGPPAWVQELRAETGHLDYSRHVREQEERTNGRALGPFMLVLGPVIVNVLSTAFTTSH